MPVIIIFFSPLSSSRSPSTESVHHFNCSYKCILCSTLSRRSLSLLRLTLACLSLGVAEGSGGGGGEPGEEILGRSLLPQQQAGRCRPCAKGQLPVPSPYTSTPPLRRLVLPTNIPSSLPPPPPLHTGQLSGSPDNLPVHPFIAAHFSSLTCQEMHSYSCSPLLQYTQGRGSLTCMIIFFYTHTLLQTHF